MVAIALAIGLGVGLTRGGHNSGSSSGSGGTGSSNSSISISNVVPPTASQPIPEAFISFAIEFGHFPDFAGNLSTPNIFSNNLLNNIGNLTGTKPYIRVGGTSADEALYNVSLQTTAVTRTSKNKPSTGPLPNGISSIEIGNVFFESYSTWPDTKYTHAFSLGLASISTVGWSSLLSTVPIACKALGNGKLLWWEYGNEPDLYSNSNPGGPQKLRWGPWGDSEYVSQWQNGTRHIKDVLTQACQDMATADAYGYIAPSFWVPDNNELTIAGTFSSGLNVDNDIKLISFHNYIGSTSDPGISLQGTLLNHTNTMQSIAQKLDQYSFLANTSIPFIISETNSLSDIGTPGISDTFGAALWTMDYNLWSASQNISRVHMQQGTNFYYNAWQPIQSNMPVATKPPYYGSIAAAAMLGNSTASEVKIANIPLTADTEAAYATYVDGHLARIAVINMSGHNATASGQQNPPARGQPSYTFSIPQITSTSVSVRRLMANGSDSVTGISFDGYSYAYELKQGVPVLLGNVTRGESIAVSNGTVSVQVMDSSAVILDFT
ncbi:hypothetical protein MMC26_006883 [Xylographa opegraphella]|nr:hypothetical protein [Xylographa opegraphella]